MDFMWTIYMFIIGAILTSFFILIGMRLPEKKSIMGRSHCDACEAQVPWHGLIPIVGYFLVRGRCHACGARVSIKYPILELLGAALFSLAYFYLSDNVIEYMVSIVFISLMLIVTVSDLEHHMVPDKVLLIIFPLLFVLRMLSDWITPWTSILGALGGFVFMFLVAWYGKNRFKKEALGGGDIKLYVLVGLFLGIELVFLSLFFAAIIALLTAKLLFRNVNPIPFVPFIFAGSLLAYVVGPWLLEWYMGLLGV